MSAPLLLLASGAAAAFFYFRKEKKSGLSAEEAAAAQWVDHGILFQWGPQTHVLVARYTDPVTGMFTTRVVGDFPTQQEAHQASASSWGTAPRSSSTRARG